jgi:hypothetical protein
MKHRLILGAAIALSIPLAPVTAQAFECPTHIARAEAAIKEGSTLIMRARSGYPLLAASLLKEARANLAEAKFHHAKSGKLHHARAIVRANEAMGYARASTVVSINGMTVQKNH